MAVHATAVSASASLHEQSHDVLAFGSVNIRDAIQETGGLRDIQYL